MYSIERDSLELFDESIIWLFKAEMSQCDHIWDSETNISGESGSEDIFCNKCGYNDHIIWY